MSKITAPKSFIQLPVDIASIREITTLDKLVYAEIYTMINVTDKFYMSNAGLGKRLGKNRRSIIRSINRLSSLGLITVKKVSNGKSGMKRLISLGGDNKSLGVVTSRHQGSDNKSLGVVTSCHGGSDTMSPDLVTSCHPNRSENRSTNRSENRDQSNSKSDRETDSKFTKICKYYNQTLMIERLTSSQCKWLFRSVHQWIKKYPVDVIEWAIRVTHKRDLQHALYNPVRYISKILINHEYHQRARRNELNHEKLQNVGNEAPATHEERVEREQKQQREAIVHMKKVGLIK